MKPLQGRTLFLLAVIVAVLWVGYLARAVVTPLVAALLLAYVLDPVVRWLQRLRLSRAAASGLVVGVTFVAIVGGGVFATTRLVQEAGSFYEDAVGEPAVDVADPEAQESEALRQLVAADPAMADVPPRRAEWDGRKWVYLDLDRDGAFRPGFAREGLKRIRTTLEEHPATIALAGRLAASEDAGTLVASSAGKWLAAVADTGKAAAGWLTGMLTMFLLFPIYLYFSLAHLPHVYEVGVAHLPAAHRARVVDVLTKVHLTLSAFFRGRLILMLVRTAVLFPVLLAFGVPFAGVCAVFGALASLIPVLGSVASLGLPIVLTLSTGAPSGTVTWLVVTLVLWEVLENNLLTPVLVGRQVGLHALTILVGTFIAGDLLGLFGMLVAIPLIAVLKILAFEFVLPEVRRQAGLPPEGPSADAAPGQSASAASAASNTAAASPAGGPEIPTT